MKVIITAGGTGGHIYPALAIVNKIKELEPNSEFIYIGTHNRMEKDIVPKHNLEYVGLEIYGLSKKNIFRNVKNVFLISKAINKCKKIMKDFKPDIVIGVGGYVTYPVIFAAHSLGIKTFIHEQNSIPGKSNRALEKYVDLIGVSFKDSEKYFKDRSKVHFTGNPCSENALDIRKISKTKFGVDAYRKLVLVVSGSLGSSVVNEKMKDFLLDSGDKDYDIIYITGKSHYESFNSNSFPSNVHIYPFIENLSGLLKDADVVVSRAGASSLSEIIALSIPSIIIPSPYVANNHQYYNALSLKNSEACIMLEEKDLNSKVLSESIDKCLDQKYREKLKSNMKSFSIKNSSTRIYELIKDIIK
ncbi:MAG: undecaprenyldiphospho-muramoylpentapeptide beta-N-acetylglucosaminyltransferase [Bacilli bacterium]|nr:undecaprenyldiphospho-muramoylpentapeptide beta-N-acetylglucosaminyltransferase [Bacilli bacterium]